MREIFHRYTYAVWLKIVGSARGKRFKASIKLIAALSARKRIFDRNLVQKCKAHVLFRLVFDSTSIHHHHQLDIPHLKTENNEMISDVLWKPSNKCRFRHARMQIGASTGTGVRAEYETNLKITYDSNLFEKCI